MCYFLYQLSITVSQIAVRTAVHVQVASTLTRANVMQASLAKTAVKVSHINTDIFL